MGLVVGILALIALLEILGRCVYPFSREARARREAGRDHRLGLSYLGGEADASTILRDLYRMEKRYLPFLGWIGASNVHLPTIETNALGFRGSDIPVRTTGEFRILITGGSFAWGLGASSNDKTVAGHLEQQLNQSSTEKRYRVLNGAFMNWSARHEYVVVTEFFDTFDPDMVISLSGYNDLVALSKGIELEALPEAHMLAEAVRAHLKPLGTLQALRKLVGTLGIWRLVVLLRELRAVGRLTQQFHRYDPQNGPRRVLRASGRYVGIADYLARKGRRYLVALEPEIYSSRKPLTVEEFDLRSRFLTLERDLPLTLTRYRRELASLLSELAGGTFQFLDLANVFDYETKPVFIDYNHVCDLGYQLVARALATAILAPCAKSAAN